MSSHRYYKTKDDAVKWKRNIPYQRGRPLCVKIVDPDSVRPTQLVPQSLQSPLDVFELTLRVSCIEMRPLHTNQKYDQYCQLNPRLNSFRGYQPFPKEEVLTLMGFSFLSGAHKCNQQLISNLYDEKCLPHLYIKIDCSC